MGAITQLERVDYGSDNGCLIRGAHRQVIQGVGATRTLLPGESGSLCLLDATTGVTYTLPEPTIGMEFDFLVSASLASGAHKVITNAATVFLAGGVINGDDSVAIAGDYFSADGTTIRAISTNGTTSGGLIGERYKVTAVSATKWVIHGVVHGNGGAGPTVTPFATA